MIDVRAEEILTFQQAALRVPRRRAGRPAAPSTLYRWATSGLKGVHLETIQVGGTRCTSMEALQRFFHQLSNRPVHTRTISETAASRAEKAMRELEEDRF